MSCGHLRCMYFSISYTSLKIFMKIIYQNYTHIPYHSYTHMYSVTLQFSFYVYTLQKYFYTCTKRYMTTETLFVRTDPTLNNTNFSQL